MTGGVLPLRYPCQEAAESRLGQFPAVERDGAERRRVDPAEQRVVNGDKRKVPGNPDVPLGHPLQKERCVVVGGDDDRIELPRRSGDRM